MHPAMVQKKKISKGADTQRTFWKKKDKLLQKQNDYRNKTNTDFKELHNSYVELQNKLKALEEKVTINESENN